MIATIFVPAFVTGPLATAASYAAVVMILGCLALANADAIRQWHARAHPLVARYTLAVLFAVFLATASGSAAVYLSACSSESIEGACGSGDSWCRSSLEWSCWLAGYGVM